MADKVEKEYIDMTDVELNDGEFSKIEADQVKKESEKEAQKDIDEKEKVIDDINDAEADKPDQKDGEGKKFKIKGLKEGQKLVLEEPTDILNESTITEDSDSFAGATDDDHVFKISMKVAAMDESDASEVARLLKELIEDYGEDYNIYLYEDPSAELVEDLNEEVIDEVLPRDLSHAYDQAGYKRGTDYRRDDGRRVDYNKANYKEITPDEALAAVKAGNFDKLRLLIKNRRGDERLVKVDPNGWGLKDTNLRISYVDSDKEYTKRTGKKVSDTAGMPGKHLFSIADKIYITDEDDEANKVDPAILDARAENPESPRYKDNLPYRNISGHYYKDAGSKDTTSWRGDAFERGYNTPYETVNRLIKNYKKALKDGDSDKALAYRNELASARARLAYANSERFLTHPVEELLKLKKDVKDYESMAEYKLNQLNATKARGSQDTRYTEERLLNARAKINQLMDELLELEVKLENSKENDVNVVAQYEQEYNDAVAKLNEIKGLLANKFSNGIYKKD